jgi:acyl carrier protein phosphodiesterase
MMPYMIANNWLLNYASIEGIQRVLNGMNNRIKNISNMNEATNELRAYYQEFENEFTLFFKELMTFSELKKIEISQKL